jgi:FixJ family two-component response regulator
MMAHGPALLPNNKVIVIDDDPSVLKGLARVLKISGFDPVVFDCAESFENERDIGEACCLVVDIHLKGKSGFELKQGLGDDVPVIFITASDSEAISVAAREAGCIAFLRKPFPAQSLIEPIRRLSGLA